MLISKLVRLKTIFLRKQSQEKLDKNFEKHFKSYGINSSVKGKKIELKDITKVYNDGIQAVTRANINIKPGEFVVLLGPSGCGKTTTLRMIAGLESISNGFLKFNNVTMNSVPTRNREISMAFQNYALYSFMDVHNNISFGLKNKGYSNQSFLNNKNNIAMAKNSNYNNIVYEKAKISILKNSFDINLLDAKKRDLKIAKIKKEKEKIKEIMADIASLKIEKNKMKNDKYIKEQILDKKNNIKKFKDESFSDKVKLKLYRKEREEIIHTWFDSIDNRVEDVTELLGIKMYTKRKPSELSGGQRQRVALGRVISKSSGIFLFDEPLSNLDAKLRAKMRVEIKDLHKKLGATSIYVTHDQIEAMSMGDKVVVMNKGFVQQIGSPLELILKPTNLFVAKFIGNTDINIVSVKHIKDWVFSNKIGFKIILSNKKDIKINNGYFKNVVCAFRPEHIIVDTPEINRISKKYGVKKSTGVIIGYELLGNEAIVKVQSKDFKNIIKILVPVSSSFKEKDTINFLIDPEKVHVYEEEYGFNLTIKFSEENQIARENWIKGEGDRIKNQQLLMYQKLKTTWIETIKIYMLAIFSPKKREFIKNKKFASVTTSEREAK